MKSDNSVGRRLVWDHTHLILTFPIVVFPFVFKIFFLSMDNPIYLKKNELPYFIFIFYCNTVNLIIQLWCCRTVSKWSSYIASGYWWLNNLQTISDFAQTVFIHCVCILMVEQYSNHFRRALSAASTLVGLLVLDADVWC